MAARLGWNNLLLVSGVVITSSTEATGYVDDNLAHQARWKRWRSATSTADQWVKFDLGANKSLQLLAAIDATLHAGGTLKAQAHATDAWGAPTVDDLFTVPSPNRTYVLTDWLGSVQSLRWVRFYFTNTVAVSAYAGLGAVFAGTYLEPTAAVAPGVGFVQVDPSIQRRATGGQRSSVRRTKYHQVSGQFRPQSDSAREDFRTAFETIGETESCVFALDSATPSLTFYGTLHGTAYEHTNPSATLWDVPFTFEEDVR
jgi:hypothetical protein